jgi:hypothetical protein
MYAPEWSRSIGAASATAPAAATAALQKHKMHCHGANAEGDAAAHVKCLRRLEAQVLLEHVPWHLQQQQ